jgi:hypothetical protein
MMALITAKAPKIRAPIVYRENLMLLAKHLMAN